MTATLPRRALAGIALAAAAFASGCAAVAEGKHAPPIQGDAWIQTAKAPAPSTRNRWALLVIFEPGSEACADGMPDVLALKKRYGPRGLSVVGVTAADAEDAGPFLKDNRVDFPVLADAEHVVDSFGIPQVKENHTYLLDPAGVVVVQSDLVKAEQILSRYMR